MLKPILSKSESIICGFVFSVYILVNVSSRFRMLTATNFLFTFLTWTLFISDPDFITETLKIKPWFWIFGDFYITLFPSIFLLTRIWNHKKFLDMLNLVIVYGIRRWWRIKSKKKKRWIKFGSGVGKEFFAFKIHPTILTNYKPHKGIKT